MFENWKKEKLKEIKTHPPSQYPPQLKHTLTHSKSEILSKRKKKEEPKRERRRKKKKRRRKRGFQAISSSSFVVSSIYKVNMLNPKL